MIACENEFLGRSRDMDKEYSCPWWFSDNLRRTTADLVQRRQGMGRPTGRFELRKTLCNPSSLLDRTHEALLQAASSIISQRGSFGGNLKVHKHGEDNHTIIHQESNEARLRIMCPSLRAHPRSSPLCLPVKPNYKGLESARSQSAGRVPSIHSVFIILLAEPR